MIISGTLTGYQSIKSKKGTDCFFAFLSDMPFNNADDALGLKVMQVAAFGQDAIKLRADLDNLKALKKKVSFSGMYQGNTFIAVSAESLS